MTPELLATIRQILTALGTAAMAFGILKPEDATPLIDNAVIAIGALSVVGSWVWSLWQKHLQKKAIAVATLSEPSPAVADAAKAVLTPQEITRAIHPTLPTAVVTATGKVV